MSMLSALIGALRVDLGMNTAAFFADSDEATRRLRKLQSDVNKIGKQMTDIGKKMSLAITTPVAGFGGLAIRSAGNFEAAMNRVQAVSQASAEQMAQLEEAAKRMGRETQFSASESASAIEMLAKNGLSASDILGGALSASMTLAAASGADLSDAGDIATDVMLQFKKSASELGGVVDGISGVLVQSKFGIDDYRLALAQAGGVAGGIGVDFDDFNASIAATSAMFASGSDAGTSFKTFLQRLVPASAEAAGLMDELGLEFFDVSGNMKDMGAIAQELQDGLQGLSDEAKNNAMSTIFGTDALRTAIGLAESGAAGIERLKGAIANTSAEDQAAARMEGFNGAVKRLQSAFEALQLAIADSGLLEFATRLVERGTEILTWLSALDPQVLATASVIAGLAAAIGPLVVVLGTVVTSFGALMPVLLAVVSPVGLVVAAIAGLVAGGVALYQNWDALKERFPIFEGMATRLETLFSGLGSLGSHVADMVAAVVSLLTGDFSGAWDSAVSAMHNWVDGVTGVLAAFAPELAAQMRELAGNIVSGLVSGLEERWDSVKNSVRRFFGATVDEARDELEIHSPSRVFREIGEQIGAGVVQGVDDTRGDAVDSVEDTAAAVAKAGKAAFAKTSQTIADALGTGDFSGGLKSLANAFAADATKSFTSAISRALSGASGSSTAGTAGGGLLSSIGASSGGLLSSIGGLFGGNAVGGGLLSKLGGLFGGASTGGTLAGLSGMASAAMPYVGAAIAAGNLIDSVIKGFSSKKTTAQGYELAVDDGQLVGAAYQTVKKSSFWGLKKKTRTYYSDLGAEAEGDLSATLAAITGGIASAYERVGVTVSDAVVSGFDFGAQKLDLRGLDSDAIAAKIATFFDDVGNAFSDAIGGLSEDVITTFAAVKSTMERLGQTFGTGLSSAANAAYDLVTGAGGLDVFNAALSVFQSNFYTAAEQASFARAQLLDAFQDLGLAMPRTARGFRDLVNAQDLTTEAGQSAYLGLLDLSAAFASVVGGISSVSGGWSMGESWMPTEYAARLAAVADARGFAVTQDVFGGAGVTGYGGITGLRGDGDAVGLLRRLVDRFEEWDATGLPTSRTF